MPQAMKASATISGIDGNGLLAELGRKDVPR